MKWRACVNRVTGKAKNYVGSVMLSGDIVRQRELSAPVSLEIVETQNGFLMYYLDAEGKPITDGWHDTLEDAFAQAEFEFDILRENWTQD